MLIIHSAQDTVLLFDIILLLIYFASPHVSFCPKILPVYRLAQPTSLPRLQRAYKFIQDMKILENPV